MSKKNAPPRFFSSLSQLESDSNMMNRDFSKLDRKKLQYEDIIKVKWKTIQYVVDNKKPQMDMLTRNMRELINEVKQETRNTQKMRGYDISDVFAAMKKEKEAAK
jgi:hypothetical protein